MKENQIYSKLHIKNSKAIWKKKHKHIPFIAGIVGYSIAFLKRIMRLKKQLEKATEEEREKIILKIIDKRLTFNWVRDYLGNHYFKEYKFFKCELCGKTYHQHTGLYWHLKVVHKKNKER